jgi:hypothetical protein
MPERRLPTLADAQRQVWVRDLIGRVLIGLSVLFLLLFLVKHLYVDFSSSPFSGNWGGSLRQLIDPLLRDWPILDLLWRAMPPWRPISAGPITPIWDYVYVVWGALLVIFVGVLLRRSAHARRAQIAEFSREMQREAWRQQARAAGGVAPDDRGPTTVIGQAIWHEYAAPPESWSQTPRGIVILSLIVTVVGGLIVGLFVLYAEYSFFQAH